MDKKKQEHKMLAQNKKARHDYFILETYECGIELFGTEVKSIRAGSVNLKESFAVIKDGEVIVHGMHISPYEQGNIFNRDPPRPKRLLLHKREIRKLAAAVQKDGLTLVPLSVYLSGQRVKLELAVAKGKKLYDKRETDAKRSAMREIDRRMKEQNS
ncbi:MAG: SsrA-binding protein SmpB [Clostridia bacterium]|nr:SsrA-binding protein SmpB [Clostridia bacterium]